MTEDEARAWVRERFGVSRETSLARFGEMLREEAPRQNLVSAATLDQLWARHLADSAQLLGYDDAGEGAWLDIGSGAGLPGLVVALLGDRHTYLVEPRRMRAQFLAEAARRLDIGDRVTVVQSRVESFRPPLPVAVVSARAVAELGALFAAARHCATRSTVWILPKGRNAQSEVEAARKAWQGSFHVERSITQPESLIVIAREIRPR